MSESHIYLCMFLYIWDRQVYASVNPPDYTAWGKLITIISKPIQFQVYWVAINK